MIIVWGYGAFYQPQMPGVHLGLVLDWSAGVTAPPPVLTSTTRIWTGLARSRTWTAPGS